jgi:Cu-Zn family superoxide dismutase
MERLVLPLLLLALLTNCQNNSDKKKEINKTVEVKVEQNDSLTTATITTKQTVNGEVSEEIQVIKGSREEVMNQVNQITEAAESKTSTPEIERQMVKKIQFKLAPKSGSTAEGIVTMTEEKGNVTFEATLTGLSDGTHAIHIHEKADCASEDGKSTGGHWNPTFENHGAWGSDTGFHRGDIGNFEVNSGEGTVTFTTELWCIGCEDPVKNIMGKAVIVHQGEDDLVSQPSGAAGARVSCAGIIY